MIVIKVLTSNTLLFILQRKNEEEEASKVWKPEKNMKKYTYLLELVITRFYSTLLQFYSRRKQYRRRS